MKTAHPASLPPGVSGSGGMRRSTSASTAAPSLASKKIHAPGLTGWGGEPASGRQGSNSARPPAAPPISRNAALPSNSRRRSLNARPPAKAGQPTTAHAVGQRPDARCRPLPDHEARGRGPLRFDCDDHVPVDHLLRSVDRFLDLRAIRAALRPYYNSIGRPTVDPELMIRMLIVGYAWASARSAVCARRSISIWRIAG